MLAVTPGQGKVANPQVLKEPAIYLFHKETNPVERFRIFPLKMKQKILSNFLSVGNFPLYFSEVAPPTHSNKMSQPLAEQKSGSSTSSLVRMSLDL